MDDYAIVVGISHYPGLSQPGMSFDLLGPDRDADAIYEWLLAPGLGGLKKENVWLIKTGVPLATEPVDAAPTPKNISNAFTQLFRRGKDQFGNFKLPLGRRLYIYGAGHGFRAATNKPALLTADAMPELLWNSYAHAWVEFFRGAGFFQEYAVWIDCCMNPFTTVVAEQLPNKLAGGAQGIAFTAIAAMDRSALEAEMSDGQTHGVFTWTLLQGLNGKAAEKGEITGESLRKFLYNAMADNLPKEVREASNVDVKPAVETDLGIVFRTGVPDPTQEVTLKLDAPDGTDVRIWGGQPHTVVKTATLAGKQSKVSLDRGLYVAEIAQLGFRQGFEVTGSGDIAVPIEDKGPAVTPAAAGAAFSLNIQVDNQAALVTVIDHGFERVFKGTGSAAFNEPAGLYKVRAQFGSDINSIIERVIVLDRSDPIPIVTPVLPGAAPMAPAPLTRGAQLGPVGAMRSAPVQTGLSVLARYWTDDAFRKKPGVTFPDPFEGLDVVDDKGAHVSGLLESAGSRSVSQADPVLHGTSTVVPGTYFIRQTLQDGRILEAPLVVVSGWLTHCVIRRLRSDATIAPTVPHVGSLGEISIFMRKAGSTVSKEEDATIEAAAVALADGRPVFEDGRGTALHDLLTIKYENPIAGIVGGHLWILSQQQEGAQGALVSGLDMVVTNLRKLIGTEHPDVEALSLKCSDPLRRKQPIRTPPMFRRSWDLLIEATATTPDIVPKELWDRVHAVSAERLHFVWAADERSRTTHKLQLRQAAAAASHVMAAPRPKPPSSPFETFRGAELARGAPPRPSAADQQKMILECAKALNVVPSAVDAAFKTIASATRSAEPNAGRFCSCLETKATHGRTRAALLRAFQWPTGSVITVAFQDGDPKLQQRIKQVAQQWIGPDMANLKFNFVNAGDADVRIAFLQGNGSWSYLGTMCRQIEKTKPTMNFGWLTSASSDDELRRVVLHEFGHAIGLIHEHQNPLKPIQWNTDAVKRDLSGPPNNWDDQTIDTNIYSHYTADDVLATAVDASSIMMYPIPKTWTIDGFSAGFNADLSETDRDLIRIAYPW